MSAIRSLSRKRGDDPLRQAEDPLRIGEGSCGVIARVLFRGDEVDVSVESHLSFFPESLRDGGRAFELFAGRGSELRPMLEDELL
jgi:hypothetical protein